jgi:hypothetical protein
VFSGFNLYELFERRNGRGAAGERREEEKEKGEEKRKAVWGEKLFGYFAEYARNASPANYLKFFLSRHSDTRKTVLRNH